jgi:Na+/glutamate symporter
MQAKKAPKDQQKSVAKEKNKKTEKSKIFSNNFREILTFLAFCVIINMYIIL